MKQLARVIPLVPMLMISQVSSGEIVGVPTPVAPSEIEVERDRARIQFGDVARATFTLDGSRVVALRVDHAAGRYETAFDGCQPIQGVDFDSVAFTAGTSLMERAMHAFTLSFEVGAAGGRVRLWFADNERFAAKAARLDPTGQPTWSALCPPRTVPLANRASAAELVERLRGLPPEMIAMGPKDLEHATQHVSRMTTYEHLLAKGPAGIAALADALRDPDVAMRRNAALALLVLGDGLNAGDGSRFAPAPIGSVLPDLMHALEDSDDRVRGYAAQAIGKVGPRGVDAVPALVRLLGSPDPGSRNSACIALRRIGPGAASAIPALERAAADPDSDLRRFAMLALEAIRGQSPQ